MAGNRFPVMVLLLVYGAVLSGVSQRSMSANACPLYCLDVDYMTCPSSGCEKLKPQCNCCLAPKQCTLHLKDATQVSCN
ncbi:hypothetical protein HHK36_009206 [Tetracentron sinense]|uniref:Bowman-Birk serine protease inhibitors family domain-containing protein n=1 Tax=Tetracentron sinense TaxID=13715 RepID=A0A835DI46_TETSI|nr:hypothetical protein HHK36_009206 [Tetracentron sinense]